MAHRATKTEPTASPSSHRAKSLPPRSSSDVERALEKYAAASAAFEAACQERCGLGRIDQAYSDLVSSAANLVVARGGAPHSELPEEDVRLAESVLRARTA